MYKTVHQAMSILQYFSVENADIGRPAEKITLPSREEAGVSSTEYDNIVAEVEIVPNKRRRTTYHVRDKVKIAKYANTYGVASAIKFFQRDFPKLTESTVRPWLKKYRAGLQKSSSGALPVISTKRGRPLLLRMKLIKNFACLSTIRGKQEVRSTNMWFMAF